MEPQVGRFRMRRMPVRDKWEKLLARKGVKLYGTRWCKMCSKQKALLPDNWSGRERFYVDCDSLRNVLECSTVKKIPVWRIAGKRYIGAHSETSMNQLLESSGQGTQRWDVADFTRRHRRRGKCAKEEFADVVKRSILKAAAAAPPPPLPVVDDARATNIPDSGEGLNNTKAFRMAPDSARGLRILVLAAATFTQENFQKLLQAMAASGVPLQRSSPSKTSPIKATTRTDAHVDSALKSFKKDEPKVFGAARADKLETSELKVCEDEFTVGQHHSTRLSNSVGRKPKLIAGRHFTKYTASKGDYLECPDGAVV